MATSEVSMLHYPNDLIDKNHNYGKSVVVFYINKTTDSSVTPSTETTTQDTVTPQTSSQQRINDGVVSYNETTTGESKSLLDSFGLDLGGMFSDAAAKFSDALSSITAKGKEYIAGSKELDCAIALYIPHNLSIQYSMEWQAEDARLMALLAQGGNAIGGAINAVGTKFDMPDITKYLPSMRGLPNSRFGTASGANATVQGFDYATATGIQLAEEAGLTGLSAALGLAPNPMKEQQFKNVNFRDFQMTFEFSPRSGEEAEMVKQIIFKFKYHMHPHFVGSKFLYKYPSEFDIVYYFDGKENENIHKHTTSVLIDMAVQYAPNGSFSMFKGGMPTKILMTLQFRELMTLSKEGIALGL